MEEYWASESKEEGSPRKSLDKSPAYWEGRLTAVPGEGMWHNRAEMLGR